MNSLRIEAELNRLEEVQDFVRQALEEAGFGIRQQMQVELAVEEIFCNIANYAYHPGKGEALIRCEIHRTEDNECLEISFIDEGTPYNPLEKEDPDVTMSADEREIGGLGIFLTKQVMDSMEYRYEEHKNILVIKKIKGE